MSLTGANNAFVDLVDQIPDFRALRNPRLERIIFEIGLQNQTATQFVNLGLNLAIVSEDARAAGIVPEPQDQGKSMFMDEMSFEGSVDENRYKTFDIRPRRLVGPFTGTRPVMVFSNAGANTMRFTFNFRLLLSW